MKLLTRILAASGIALAFAGSAPTFAATAEEVVPLFWRNLPGKIKPVDKYISPADQTPWIVIFKYHDDDGSSSYPFGYSAEIHVSDSPIFAEGFPDLLERQAKIDHDSTYSKIKIGGRYDAVMRAPIGERTKYVYLAAPGRTGERRYLVTLRIESGGASDIAQFDSWVTAILEDLPLAALAKLK